MKLTSNLLNVIGENQEYTTYTLTIKTMYAYDLSHNFFFTNNTFNLTAESIKKICDQFKLESAGLGRYKGHLFVYTNPETKTSIFACEISSDEYEQLRLFRNPAETNTPINTINTEIANPEPIVNAIMELE